MTHPPYVLLSWLLIALIGTGCIVAAQPDVAPTPVTRTTSLAQASLDDTRPRPEIEPTATPTPAPDPIDLLLGELTVPQKVGQLFLLTFSGSNAESALPALVELQAGGIVLLDNVTNAGAARTLTAGLQDIARAHEPIPPLIAIDHEGGAVQRIRTGLTAFGPNWNVGQVRPLVAALAEACRRGDVHGRELAELGIQMNFAPVLDIWDNPRNTVIGDRSYSANEDVAAQLGSVYIRALQSHGVLAVGKHFPGHGSTDEDSHATLPVWPYDRATLDRSELVPFRAAIAAQVAGLMTAHVSYPSIDAVPNRPASLSPTIVHDLLRGELGYEGLVISDDLGMMRAVTDGYEPGEAAIRAFLAGNDLLTVAGSIDRQRQMVEAITSEVGGRIEPARLDQSVRRIQLAKQRTGLLLTEPRLPALPPADP